MQSGRQQASSCHSPERGGQATNLCVAQCYNATGSVSLTSGSLAVLLLQGAQQAGTVIAARVVFVQNWGHSYVAPSKRAVSGIWHPSYRRRARLHVIRGGAPAVCRLLGGSKRGWGIAT